MNLTKSDIFFFSLMFVAFVSPGPYCKIPLGNTYVNWFFAFCIYSLIPYMKRRYNPDIQSKDYVFVKYFLLWLLVGVVRGVFVADNYWEFKNMIHGTMACMVPMFTYVFTPYVQQRFYRSWVKYCIPAFFLFYLWMVTPGEVNFYLAPVFVLGCFTPYIPKKWRIAVIFLLGFMLVADLGGRSQVLKAALAVVFSLACIFRRFISTSMLRLAHWCCYGGAIVLVALGVSGVFNVFEDMGSHEGEFTQKKMVNGEMHEEDMSSDTRTFIYVEVLNSAVKNNYIWCGRSMARGNDSMSFGSYNAENLKTGKYERYGNELLHLNIFTWLGVVGVVLFSLIFIRSSYLAVYRSKSYYVKLIGVFIAFHWAYGWVEDTTNFDIMNISLWSALAIGLSSQFRAMTDEEFLNWFKGIFTKEKKTASI